MDGSLLNQGILLMLVGMGTVFVFLTLLVIAMSTLSSVVTRLSPPAPALDGPSADELAAITAAVEHHRRSTQV
ncbi:MAG: OadG family protein [Pseudomonadota bacterium]